MKKNKEDLELENEGTSSNDPSNKINEEENSIKDFCNDIEGLCTNYENEIQKYKEEIEKYKKKDKIQTNNLLKKTDSDLISSRKNSIDENENNKEIPIEDEDDKNLIKKTEVNKEFSEIGVNTDSLDINNLQEMLNKININNDLIIISKGKII
jgi:hypothetical protein